MLRFSVYNGSGFAISVIHCGATLTLPGAKTPLSSGGLFFNFAPPLQPRVQQTVSVPLVSDVLSKQLDGIYNVDLTLKVSNVDDTSGKRLLVTDTDVLDSMRHKRDVLRGG